jgi:rhamnosyltransferase
MQSQSSQFNIASIVVSYRPNLATLDLLLTRLLSQTKLVVLVDNGGGKEYLHGDPEKRTLVHYLGLGTNHGLGHALNAGMAFARAKGYDLVVTFDQDSLPTDGMLDTLWKAYLSLGPLCSTCAAIGPSFYDRREKQTTRFPLYREQNGKIATLSADPQQSTPIVVDVLITSGMLVNVAAWSAGIHYNEDLVVDYTDTDWCFRARSAGYQLYVCPKAAMAHELSDTPPIRILGISLLRYSPIRRYYYFRNTIYFIRQTYVSRAWKKRLALGLMVRFIGNNFIDRQKIKSLYMTSLGLMHGYRKIMGIRHD